ncbi:2-octaprenyl-6-methoxyphenol hydroxylase [Nicoletella semolina]|uniref:2-octaprenyl-6-methoxyphenol hydroxylase n=1 Tax=Nicoletella semolina TaxID=271160 RepID=A0A4R2N5F2_9PAST|nr:2-octaprenyl-6-methoxyphenyl hydroxylase [Nicoletella semolina]MDH2925463.1 2-octaprenyl-6-methoxyphenyl hydroxylase [Nicoletella semolina]TCP16084.1 2-octaprenyl-6-methoxyphenol hydroxylase [Nicoletella semolina]
MTTQFDVVIVGGAVTGSVLALALSSATTQKLKIALIEKSRPDYDKQGGFDARSIALAYGSLQKLARIQPLADSHLAEIICQFATPIKHIHISDQGHFGKTEFSAQTLGIEQLGVVVELAELGKTLANLLSQQPNIQQFCPDTIAVLERTTTDCKIKLASGTSLTAKLLVASDGIHSSLARQCGVITETVKDYQQSAIIANVQLAQWHQYQAFERFTPQGPFALLPLKGNNLSLVWCVQDTTPLIHLSDNDFLNALQQQFGWKLGKFQRVSKRFVYPLSLQKTNSHIHHRLAIIGNAAQQLHPVAGQGFNLGLRDLFTLCDLITQAFLTEKDIGETSLLSEFERRRIADQQKMMQATNGLISIFSSPLLPVQLARNLGLSALTHFPRLNNQIAHQALGW